MTVLQSIKALSNYPIPQHAITQAAVGRGMLPSDQASASIIKSSSYKLLQADILKWLSNAPNVSEGGVSFSFSESERKEMRREASRIYSENGEEEKSQQFGYIGDQL